jgi:HEAT repeat protein
MDKILAAIGSEKAKERQKALDSLEENQITDEMIEKVNSILSSDVNENVRIASCAIAGKYKISALIAPLKNVVRDSVSTRAVKSAAIEALSQYDQDTEIAQFFGEVISQNTEIEIRRKIIGALIEVGGKLSAEILFGQLNIKEKDTKARIARELGNLSRLFSASESTKVLKQLREFAEKDADPSVRRACMSSSSKYPAEDHAKFIKDRFDGETDEKNKIRCIELLGEIGDAHALKSLSELLVVERNPSIRSGVITALSKMGNWQLKADTVLASILQNNEIHRPGINGPDIITAITGEDSTARTNLGKYLISQAVGATSRVISVIASLLIASVGGNVNEAGNLINQFVSADPNAEEQLHQLRIEVGGASSLEPILKKLQDNLELHFQKPITELNNLTTGNWIMTVKCVYWGFVARLTMSVCTFIAGFCLTIWSVYQFSLDRETAIGMWGAGISMFTGIGSMLIVVYTGPLKDIGKSVEELAKANAIFIGFIHSVLQISHTFSAKYIQGDYSFDETAQSNQLVQKTVRHAVEQLTLKSSVEKIDDE